MHQSTPKFAYFGTPYVARDTLAYLAEHDYIPSVVITSPDAAKGRGLALSSCPTKEWALDHYIPVLTPSILDEKFLEELTGYGCEYGIAVAYGKIIPQAVIDSLPKGILNVHYSLLPKYRGASPVESALLNGDTSTGVSVQKMVFKLDAGDVLASEAIDIDPSDTTLTLRPKLIALGSELLVRTLPDFIAGTAIATPQDQGLATRAPKILKEQGLLNIATGDAVKNWNTYSALKESPGTYFLAERNLARIRVKIKDASFSNNTFVINRIIPEGKSEQDFSYLEKAGWTIVTPRSDEAV